MPLDLLNFVRKWNASTLVEKSGSQTHFRDLCEVLGVPPPIQDDDIGANYTFEKRVTKAGTQEIGFADVWKRGFFAWEYKSKGGDLNKAYKQLNEYHEGLENPPILVVCDFVRFVVHTKFENAPSREFAFTLDDLLVQKDTATCALPPRDVLRHVFGDYNKLRPEVVAIPVTRAAAADFLNLAQRLELERSLTPIPPTKEEIAHFLMRLVFCLFADSVGLLPDNTFRRMIANNRESPISFNRMLPELFQAMSKPDSFFGPANIPYFNGGLFRDDKTIPLDYRDLGVLKSAAHHDWSHVEPAIFGTLFERSLDSAKRSMIGAHYTSPEDILLLIEPVVIAPLQRRWETVKNEVLEALAAEPPLNRDGKLAASLRINRPALTILQNWATELTTIRILDPACGSGNFLYIALKRLLDLWHQARIFGIEHGLSLALDPIPDPSQLFGIEIDFYAHEIASVVVWIGFLQWKHDHGYRETKTPLLQVLTNIQHDDAILRYDKAGRPYEPEWPAAEYIVSNPPFLGDKKMRGELNIQPHPHYVDDLRSLYTGRVPGGADLVTFWFEKSRAQIAVDRTERAGLLATQGIRGGANRTVLKRIVDGGAIFMAWSDRPWILEGAAVRVSMIGFDDGTESHRSLDGANVDEIHPNLTSEVKTTSAVQLEENDRLSFIGPSPHGRFDIDSDSARKMLSAPLNVNGRPNSDVIRPVANAIDLVQILRNVWTIDFGSNMPLEDAAKYEMPFEFVEATVYPTRSTNHREAYKEKWWLYGEARPGMRKALNNLARFIASPRVSKHRIFVWQQAAILCNDATIVFARDDDYFFGILQSKIHELWARAQGTQLREVESGFRYTPNSTFLTFPFPWPPGTEPSEAESPIVSAIAEAARELVRLRDAWLNPPDISAADLKKRTLTNLYNERPTWLANAHRTLDEAVFAAYGWPANLTTQEILARLLALNHERAASQNAKTAAKPSRKRNKPKALPTSPATTPS